MPDRGARRLMQSGEAAIEELEAQILVEQAKREAAELIGGYERELFEAGRFVEFMHLGTVRCLLMAPIDFVERIDALRAACPEMDRLSARAALRERVAEWLDQLDRIDEPRQRDDDGN